MSNPVEFPRASLVCLSTLVSLSVIPTKLACLYYYTPSIITGKKSCFAVENSEIKPVRLDNDTERCS